MNASCELAAIIVGVNLIINCENTNNIVPGAHFYFITATPPVLSLSCLRNDLDGVAYKWFELGIQLDIDDGDLSAIEADASRAPACLRSVIRHFLRSTDGLSDEDRKEKLVKAMKSQSVGEIRRGGKLERGTYSCHLF